MLEVEVMSVNSKVTLRGVTLVIWPVRMTNDQ